MGPKISVDSATAEYMPAVNKIKELRLGPDTISSTNRSDGGYLQAQYRLDRLHRRVDSLLGAWKDDLALAGGSAGVEVITSPDRSDIPLDRGFIRAVFTMRTRTWPDGKLVKVFVLPDESEAHRRFCNELLGIYPYRLRNGWDRAVFTGTGLSPGTVDSLEEMEKTVRETPGAIGYVVRVDGQ